MEMKQKNRKGKNLRGSLICLLILILAKDILLCKKSVTENTRNGNDFLFFKEKQLLSGPFKISEVKFSHHSRTTIFEKLALKTWNESLGKDETFVRRVKFCLVKISTLSDKLSLKYHQKWGIPGQNNFFSFHFRK